MACLVMASTISVNADDDKNRDRKRHNPDMMAQQHATRIARKLMLDDATSARFIETYKAFSAEKREVYHKYANRRSKQERQYMSDAEVEQQITNRFAMSRAIIDVREKYYKKFRTFLTPRQIATIYAKERDDAGRMRWEKQRRDRDDAIDRNKKKFRKNAEKQRKDAEKQKK